jgi:hypothetical protein
LIGSVNDLQAQIAFLKSQEAQPKTLPKKKVKQLYASHENLPMLPIQQLNLTPSSEIRVRKTRIPAT